MKKVILAASIAVSGSLVAGDWYVGANIAHTSTKLETAGASTTNNASSDKTGYTIKGGYAINKSNSVELEFVRITKNIAGPRLNYVFRYPIKDMGLFIGGGIGYVDYKEDFTVNTNTYTLNKRATAWNIKGGATYKIAKKHEIGLGYDYIGIRNISESYPVGSQSVDINLKDVRFGRLYAEYNYFF
jgi:opacity protein-like surface antigen